MPGITRVGLDPISRGPLHTRSPHRPSNEPDQSRSGPPHRPPLPAPAATGSSHKLLRGSVSAAAEKSHRFLGPIHTRPPIVRAHPTRRSYDDVSLGPPTSVALPART